MADAGVDAVIVQDLGLVKLIKSIAPTLSVHASTQMTLTEPRGIEFVRKLGVERVVLARELSLADIQKVTAGTNTPVEVFVHDPGTLEYFFVEMDVASGIPALPQMVTSRTRLPAGMCRGHTT